MMWEVYLKIKEISSKTNYQQPLHIDTIAGDLKLDKAIVIEYVIALKILEYVKVNGSSGELITLTDAGRC